MLLRIAYAAGALALALILPAIAHASDATVPLGPWFDMLKPYIEAALMPVVAAVAGWLVYRFERFTGVEIDAKNREALQSAMDVAVAWAINRLGDKARAASLEARHELIAMAADYVRRSTPDALAYFGISAARLAEMVEARLDPRRDEGGGAIRRAAPWQRLVE